MNIGQLVNQMAQNKPLVRRHPAANSPLETSKGIFSTSQDLYGDDDYTYYVLLIHLFDRAILQDNLHTLSIEQQKLLERYFLEAHPYTKKWNEATNKELSELNLDVDWSEIQITPEEVLEFYNFVLPKDISVLDDFLGSYLGEEHGPYSRYGKEQFYS